MGSIAGSGLDSAKTEQFAERMLGMLNESFLALMTSIGHQTGLFDAMAELAPTSSEEIARAANLNERYVREWLGAMVTGGIVDYDAARRVYSLPKEHAAALTRAAGSANVAAFTQFVSCIGEVEPRIVECFHKGGGLKYADYSRFHDITKDSSKQTFEETLLHRTLPLVPDLVERLREGIDVLDVGCGSGYAINLMAREFPKSRFCGYDFSEEAVANGRQDAATWNLKNARFEVQDVSQMKEQSSFDFITAFDSIHDQAKPRQVLSCIASALRDDGTFLMVDIDASSHLEKNISRPLAPFLYAISTMHCMSVSLGLDGEGLGTVWGEELALELLDEAGFTDVEVQRVEGDLLNSFYIAKKE